MTDEQLNTFFDLLKKACDFKRGFKGMPTWNCQNDFTQTNKILDTMGISKEDQTSFITYCHEHGAYCDCEIIVNIAEELFDKECCFCDPNDPCEDCDKKRNGI